jgi:hypothetical protein
LAAKYDAFAKAMLPVVQLPCVIGFNTLWGRFKNPRLMIVLVCSLFTALFVPVYIGLITGGQYDIDNEVYTHNEEWLAYLCYYAVELKSVICPVMIWCVVNDLTPPKLAKIAYPPIVFAIQVGTVMGAQMAAHVTWFGGNTGLVLYQVVFLVLAMICGVLGVQAFKSGAVPDVYLPAPVLDAPVTSAAPPADEKEGCGRALLSGVEGIWLILSHPYLLCTAFCSVAHLVPRLFLDFQGTQVVNNYCDVQHPHDGLYDDCKTSFFGWVNTVQSLGTMLLALCATRKIVEYGGLRLSLSVLPVFGIVGVLSTFLTVWSLGTTNYKGALPEPLDHAALHHLHEHLRLRPQRSQSRDAVHEDYAEHEVQGQELVRHVRECRHEELRLGNQSELQFGRRKCPAHILHCHRLVHCVDGHRAVGGQETQNPDGQWKGGRRGRGRSMVLWTKRRQ